MLGYDFLVDSSAEIAADLADVGVIVDDELADGFDSGGAKWDRDDAADTIVPDGGAPDLISFNAHFDHYRALPADGDQVPNFTNNFLADTVLNRPDGLLSSTIVFSMGCHGGLNVPDLQIGEGPDGINLNGDWAQTFAADQAIFIGNTGFGYGDTEAVAYSERLLASFAEFAVRPTDLGQDRQTTIGQALLFAKNDYAADLSVFSVYDEKALMELVFYGLPFYTVDVAPVSAPPVPDNDPVPDLGNLAVIGVNTEPDNTVDTDNERGDFYFNPDESGDPQVIVSPGRPIQPSLSEDVSVVADNDTTELAETAHGALVLGMDSVYIDDVDPVVAAVVFNEGDDAPEPPVGDVVFPAKPVTINTTITPGGERQTLVVATGQFDSNGNVQRLDDDINTVVYYSDPGDTDFDPPTIGVVESTLEGNLLTITTSATDTEGDVVRVYALARAITTETSVTWTGIDLVRTGGTDEWSGSLSLPDADGEAEFLIQAVDSSGNVGFATNKARNFNDEPVVTAPPAPDLAVTLSQANFDAGTGWYTGDVVATVVALDDTVYEISPGTPATPVTGSGFTIAGEGVFQWKVTAPDGQSASGTVRIDASAPTATIGQPLRGTTYLSPSVPAVGYACSDPSLVSCEARVTSGGVEIAAPANGDPLPNAPGTYRVDVQATDVFGNTASDSVTYTVAPFSVDLSIDELVADGVAIPGEAVDIVGTFSGGRAPYSVTVDWGDDRSCPGVGSCGVEAPIDDDPGLVDAARVFPTGGTYTIGVVVTDATGATATAAVTTAVCTITGTGRADVLNGTNGDDVICGLGGDDEIRGRGGNDVIFAGRGHDRIWAGRGSDVVFGGRGADRLLGDGGDDELRGGRGPDLLDGGNGQDRLHGGRGQDELRGMNGVDLLWGGRGDDLLVGGTGADQLFGGRGDDEGRGQAGDDRIVGGSGDDTLRGDAGADRLSGNRGDDDLIGGSGDDTIDGGRGIDRCRGGAGKDRLVACER